MATRLPKSVEQALLGRRSKYRAVPTVVDGIRFASKKEARRWGELCLMLKGELIVCLQDDVTNSF